MKTTPLITALLAAVLLLGGCATTEEEVPTDRLQQGANVMRYEGKVINIREVKKEADLGKQVGAAVGGAVVGALIGGAVGGNTGSGIGGTTGAFIGQDVMNEKYGEVVDRLILRTDDGREFQALVHGHDFKVGDPVVFTVVGGHVTAIVHRRHFY